MDLYNLLSIISFKLGMPIQMLIYTPISFAVAFHFIRKLENSKPPEHEGHWSGLILKKDHSPIYAMVFSIFFIISSLYISFNIYQGRPAIDPNIRTQISANISGVAMNINNIQSNPPQAKASPD